jgi:2-polyprenyl-3-methyl-5-hydroxy-6-metoxy-1,4-benzoquinol methylase
MNEPIELQRKNWNAWNVCREDTVGQVSRDQQAWLDKWLHGRTTLKILDAGCGAGWTCRSLLKYGSVVGTDLADEILERAQLRVPDATFIPGDFMVLDLDDDFDVIVSLEVLSHVADQEAFVRKLGSHLKPGGELLMATQNAPILKRVPWIEPAPPGHLRRWVNRQELTELLEPYFIIEELHAITPAGETGYLRIVNSRKVGWVIGALIGAWRWQALREALGIGWTLMVRARKR